MWRVGCSLLGVMVRWVPATARVLLPFVLDRARAAGFSAVEMPVPGLPAEELHRLAEAVRATGGAVGAVHAPKHLVELPYEKSVEVWATTCAFTRTLGAGLVVVHPTDLRPDPKVVESMAREAGELTLAFENVNHGVFAWVSAFTGRCDCGVTLDISHAQHFGIPLERYFVSNVVHTHLRGYHPSERYHRLHHPDAELTSLLCHCKEYGYQGLLLLEYPYQSWSEATADRLLLLEHIDAYLRDKQGTLRQ